MAQVDGVEVFQTRKRPLLHLDQTGLMHVKGEKGGCGVERENIRVEDIDFVRLELQKLQRRQPLKGVLIERHKLVVGEIKEAES